MSCTQIWRHFSVIDGEKDREQRMHPCYNTALVAAPAWRLDRRRDFREPAKLESDTTCDTVIIGGGIVGIAVAYHLAQFQNVVLLESSEIGSGSSGWNAGILSLSTTLDLAVLGDTVGKQQGRQLAFGLKLALEKLRTELGLDSEVWQTGRSIFAASKPSHRVFLDDENGVLNDFGLPNFVLGADILNAHWANFSGALAMEEEHAVQPYQLLLKLAQRATSTNTEVEMMETLTGERRIYGAEQLLARLPNNDAVRNLAVSIGMLGLKLHDLLS